ncbi:hypothetical protein AB6A40_006215 [Gnathostoma spinigerum]|uniref:Secreted protein n=1 Tax=Gnathostoma spinigerum TaxID=75299 RepID=A0ABD6EID4_9BILA
MVTFSCFDQCLTLSALSLILIALHTNARNSNVNDGPNRYVHRDLKIVEVITQPISCRNQLASSNPVLCESCCNVSLSVILTSVSFANSACKGPPPAVTALCWTL